MFFSLEGECEIDTGSTRPIACKNPKFGPQETSIIEKAISKLLDLKHIIQFFSGEWLSKLLLVAKPHQENVTCIDNFVWHFCVSYVALNLVTRIIAMPIPCCDEAVGNTFGMSQFRWLMDAISGYNQIRVAKSSQEKLAFAGPGCTKYTWLVMPFGPINGPVIFIVLIHGMNSTWQELARTCGIVFDADTGTEIIVDDVFSWAKTWSDFMTYLECQLQVCLSQNLSLSLKKSLFCPDHLEFVGVDVDSEGNCPAMSKHSFVLSFPIFETVRDIASFLGFMMFYSKWIAHFEQQAAPLHALVKNDMTTPVAHLMKEAKLAS